MTSLFRIHDTVLRVCHEAERLIPEIPLVQNENDLLSELICCILGSQEKFEVSLAVMKLLDTENVLKIPKSLQELRETSYRVKRVLSRPVCFKYNERDYSRRLRFFVKKGQHVVDTLERIYLNNLTISEILNNNCIQETRDNIITYGCGIGPKQASMFLRNIGYCSDFAVLDRHVIDYMRLMGLTDITQNSVSHMSSYREIEMQLKSYAQTYDVSLLHLDMAIWTTMRMLRNH